MKNWQKILEKKFNSSEVFGFSQDGYCFFCKTTPTNLIKFLTFLRDDKELKFKILTDLFGVDYPNKNKRFLVVYNLLSLKYNQRIIIHVELAEGEKIPTICKLYSAANWYEREAWDMYGIEFDQHPDLRRILTDYGFEGYPLRKDFPLTGKVEVRYDPEQKKVIYEPVKLDQEYRNFDFVSPWEGSKYVLPGDEKGVSKR